VLDGLQEWPTAGEDLERPDVQAWVRQALGRLPQRARSWLLAFHRDGRRIREIAGEHGVRSNTVEVALSRGRVSFRRAFLDTVLGGGDGRFRAHIDEAARDYPSRTPPSSAPTGRTPRSRDTHVKETDQCEFTCEQPHSFWFWQ
jgi:Sigma-70, region 4